jgi:hypothetical protein
MLLFALVHAIEILGEAAGCPNGWIWFSPISGRNVRAVK